MESTLNLQFKELQARVGSFMGWGRGAAYQDPAWNDQQQFEVDGIVGSGLRQFYFPAIEGAVGYEWSFLRPTATFDLPSGAQTLALPDDFGGFEGQLTLLTTNSTSLPWRIEWRNEGIIRQMYSVTPSMTGAPKYATEQTLKGTTATQSQRSQLFVFPQADQDYTLQGQYYINPDYLSGAFPYAYGGAPHAETLLESCLCVAEQRLDDANAVHAQKFQERLMASIAMDRRNKPQKLGYNDDRSDERGFDRRDIHYFAPAATYNGSAFG